jgi:hypothetical protein
MVKPTVRSPRSIAEEKNDPAKFQGEDGYDAVAGMPSGVGSSRGSEGTILANPVNQADPPKEWAASSK